MARWDRCSECREIMGDGYSFNLNRDPLPYIRLHSECVLAYAARAKQRGLGDFLREMHRKLKEEGKI